MKEFIKGQRMLDQLQKIAFIRTAGSPEEHHAATLIQEEIARCHVKSVLEPFPIDDAEQETATLTVLAPYEKSYTVTAYKCAQNTSAEGIVADFLYIENATDAALSHAMGKIVLLNGFLRLPVYKKIVEAGAVGLITMTGTLLDKEDETDLFTRKLREPLQQMGLLPAANLRISDAFELVQKGACKARLCMHSTPITRTSHNVVASIEGTQFPQQMISFGAHYDSVPFSTGVYDNGAGSVILLEMLRYFSENPPLRTIKFMWYGAEEVGLEGSNAYVKQHADELAQHLLMLNVDVAGPVLGYDVVAVTGEKSMVSAIDFFMKTKGYPVEVSQEIYSSDSIPYADRGIPSLNFCRRGAEGGSFIHCRNDVMRYLSADALHKTATLVLDCSATLLNAPAFPFERTMPTEMVEAVDQYLHKKLLSAAHKADAQA